jgi:DNA repair protein RecO (recombination protein O)
MTVARAWFAERPRQELVRLDQLEIIRSPLSSPIDSARLTVLSFFAEVLDEALPDHDPQETVFRLLLAVLDQTTAEQPWMPLTYFSLWMTRLMGILPDIAHCTACGRDLELAQRMLRAPATAFAAEPWPRRRGADLRRFTLQSIERHLERKLRSAEALARLGG